MEIHRKVHVEEWLAIGRGASELGLAKSRLAR